MSRNCLLITVLLLALAAGISHADLTFSSSARYLGMGNTGIAGADDAAAIDYNPAALGVMNIYTHAIPDRYWLPKDQENLDRKLIIGQFIGSASIGGNLDMSSGYAAMQDIDEIHKKFGVAVTWKTFNDLTASVNNPPNSDSLTFGYGHEFFWEPWTWGWSFTHARLGTNPSDPAAALAEPRTEQTNSLQLGGLYWLRQKGLSPQHNIRFGLVVQDAFAFSGGPFLNLGVSVPLGETLRVNLDYNDVFGTEAPLLNVGAEWAPTDDWRVRLGDVNLAHQQGSSDAVTAGAGWLWKRWEADVAYVNAPNGADQQWVASGSYKF